MSSWRSKEMRKTRRMRAVDLGEVGDLRLTTVFFKRHVYSLCCALHLSFRDRICVLGIV